MSLMSKTKQKTPEGLLEDALAAFETAQAKVASAIESVDSQIFSTVSEMDVLQDKLDNCNSVRERLARVGNRIQEFVS